jgi:hypothetical protein
MTSYGSASFLVLKEYSIEILHVFIGNQYRKTRLFCTNSIKNNKISKSVQNNPFYGTL